MEVVSLIRAQPSLGGELSDAGAGYCVGGPLQRGRQVFAICMVLGWPCRLHYPRPPQLYRKVYTACAYDDPLELQWTFILMSSRTLITPNEIQVIMRVQFTAYDTRSSCIFPF